MELKTTPLVEEHRQAGAQMAPFGGWLMPIQYSGIIAEHQWTRSSVCLFDICHMGEFFIHGDPRQSGLDALITADLSSLRVGGCRYGFLLNDAGGIRDDVIVYRLENETWMLVVNAATTAQDAGHLRAHLHASAKFEDASNRLGKLDLQGPGSQGVLERLIGTDIGALSYYTCGYFKLWGRSILISRTGYTGERGYELYCPAEDIVDAWRRLMDERDVHPAGLGARDTLRLEMGYPLYGQDITQETTPLEAGMGRFVEFSKGFIGKEALQRQREQGVSRYLVCFQASGRRAPRHDHRIHTPGHRDIGSVTSGSFSPSLGCGIGMGYVSAALKQGEQVLIHDGKRDMEAKIVEKPFYRKGTAR